MNKHPKINEVWKTGENYKPKVQNNQTLVEVFIYIG